MMYFMAQRPPFPQRLYAVLWSGRQKRSQSIATMIAEWGKVVEWFTTLKFTP